jgi:glutamate N-acetyltransferase/amino-acid N-acetyltransferase
MAGALPVSPLAPATIGELPPVAGVRIATAATGLRYKNRPDLLVMAFDEGTSAAGVFTLSATRAAPVDWCRDALKRSGGKARALVVNSGNANAFTGKAGMAFVDATVAAAAGKVGCAAETVAVASTGVIGEPLPAAALVPHVEAAAPRLGSEGWLAAAGAIRTTDTFAKLATVTATIGGVEVRLNGIAKGSGMVEPNMATILGYIATDAAVPPAVLQAMLSRAADLSFNAITVDSDTSTNDTLMMFATGAAGNPTATDAADPLWSGFVSALTTLAQDLARQIVRDGEGAQKFISVTVSGAKDEASARRIAKCVANSPLVKTAIAGEDANWGRLVMAVGKSGEPVERDRIAVSIGGVTIARAGGRVEGYDEAPVTAHMKGREIDILLDLGIGAGTATVWTCDLTHGYININADYRS